MTTQKDLTVVVFVFCATKFKITTIYIFVVRKKVPVVT
jgi:hypothetical protein